jgi:hypothetical protein
VSKSEAFTETTNSLARAVEPPCDAGLVRQYADMGLLECQRLANGVRLFKRSAAARVAAIRAQRLARRGGRHAPKRPSV